MVMQEYNKDKKQYQKDQQTCKSLDKLYRKSLKIIKLIETNMNLYVKVLLNICMKRKMNLFVSLNKK